MSSARATTRTESKLSLVVLQFAGGNQYAYRTFEPLLRPVFDWVTVELPGRGRRFAEPLLDDLGALALDLRRPLFEAIQDRPYALFGHSMGARLAYLLAHRLPVWGAAPPVHLLVSAARAPSRPAPAARHTLESPQFIAELRKMGGTCGDFLNTPELVTLFEPVLRADIKATETFTRGDEPLLTCPITVFCGASDDVDAADVEPWREETTGPFVMHTLPGGHFFLFEDRARFAKLMIASLSEGTRERSG